MRFKRCEIDENLLFILKDTGEHANQQEQFDFGTSSDSDIKRQKHYQNSLNIINSVLLRKIAKNKLSR
jgi:hypothetical protein